MPDPTTIKNDAEIDIYELLSSLWSEKATIAICILGAATIGALKAFKEEPSYLGSLQIQIPQQSEIDQYKPYVKKPHQNNARFIPRLPFANQQDATNQAEEIQYTTSIDEAFSTFLSILASDSHISQVINDSNSLFKGTFGIDVNSNTLKTISTLREIRYPNTSDKKNNFAPDQYTLSVIGKNREAIKTFLLNDINIASNTTTHKIKKSIDNKLSNLIKNEIKKKNLKYNSILKKIDARKTYLLASRKDRITQLKQAHHVASELNIEDMTPISRALHPQTIFNADTYNKSPLYLLGTKLLSIKIQQLEKLTDKDFIDSDLRSLEAQLFFIKSSDKYIQQLQDDKDSLERNKHIITFHDKVFNIPDTPIKPEKTKIITTSILIGLLLGLLITALKVAYKIIKPST